jgi:hypothetical protein
MRLRTISLAALLCVGSAAQAGELATQADAKQALLHPIKTYRIGKVQQKLGFIEGAVTRLQGSTARFAVAQARVQQGEFSALNGPAYQRRQAYFDAVNEMSAAVPMLENVSHYAATNKVGVAQTEAMKQKLVVAVVAFKAQTKGFVPRMAFGDDPSVAEANAAYQRLDALVQPKK